MPRKDDLTRLFSAVAQGDLAKARAVAGDIANREERSGKPGAAAALRKALVVRNGARDPDFTTTPVARLAGPDVLTEITPASLKDVKLTTRARATLVELAKEFEHRALLRQHQVEPRNRLFFYGPPGCGKTLAARAIAGQLGLPIYVVRFDSLLGSYLGQTSLRLHEVFRFAAATECVLLLDEIDAIGRKRGHIGDIAEVDRIVITLMQQLDLIRPAGLLIAASNVPGDIDAALFRRFDVVLEFPAPNRKSLSAFALRVAKQKGLKLVNGLGNALTSASTYADVEKIVADELRRTLVREG